MHTWKTDENLIWENKCEIPIDYEEYKLLNPNYYEIENQDDFLNTLNFSDYFNEELYKKYGGDSYHEWRPKLIRNHLCALESQKRVTNMVLNNNKKYDYIIYVRPDVTIETKFDMKFLSLNEKTIAISNKDHCEGYNDKFAIVNYNECEKYGKRIDEIIEFRKNNGRIVSEKYVKFIVNKYFENINFIDFYFELVRP
jgi:UDP-galactopyranose mutase